MQSYEKFSQVARLHILLFSRHISNRVHQQLICLLQSCNSSCQSKFTTTNDFKIKIHKHLLGRGCAPSPVPFLVLRRLPLAADNVT